MAVLRSKKFRIGASIFAALVLIVVVGGFAFSRGYFMRFVVEGKDISRDQFLADAETGMSRYCAQGEWAVGWFYIYETHCFNTEAEVETYMNMHFGST